MEDATDHSLIIHTNLATRVGRQKRSDLRSLLVGPLKHIASLGPLPHGRRGEKRDETDSATRLLGFHLGLGTKLHGTGGQIPKSLVAGMPHSWSG